jgi:hypothetical protein
MFVSKKMHQSLKADYYDVLLENDALRIRLAKTLTEVQKLKTTTKPAKKAATKKAVK